MKRIFDTTKSLWVLCALVLFQGCLTIEEHYTFKKNGSGTMEFVMDMSEFGKMMEAMGEAFDEGSEEKGTDALSDTPLNMLEDIGDLESVEGISSVKRKEEEFRSSIAFKFEDLKALNRAMNVLMPDSTGAEHTFFTKEGSMLKRHHNNDSEMSSSLDDSGEDEGLKLLQKMKYKISVKAPRVKTASKHDKVLVTQVNKKKVEVESDFATIAENPGVMDLEFDLSK